MTATLDKPATLRLRSIDAMRGLTVAFMILVNTAGDGAASYAQLRHAAWNGCTLTDLVFPTFMTIMGLSAALSIGSRLRKGIAKSVIAMSVLRRSVILVLLGLAINALPYFHLAELRYCGVLQRIGICYLVVSLVYLYSGTRGALVLTVTSLLVYWFLLTRLQVPGFGFPGRDIPVLDPVGNLASYIDRLLIPEIHRYRHGFYDPEGILSTLPAFATVGFGMLAAPLVSKRKAMPLAVIALTLVGSGLLWNLVFPLNKRLWTSSYAMFAGGVALGLMALFLYVVDERGLFHRPLRPLIAFGKNALFAYVFSELLGIAISAIRVGNGTLQSFTYHLLPAMLGSNAFRSLVWSLLFVAVCYLPIHWMDRRGIVVKL